MNILIVADKSDVKTYQSVIKSAPNTSVLGAVTTVTTDFIRILKEKWHPHIVVIDTSVPTKKVNLKNIIEKIKSQYPYMKVIVLAESDDTYIYPAFAVIKGQISNIEFSNVINQAQNDSESIQTHTENNIASETPQDKTEVLSKKDFNDNININPYKIKKPKKKSNRKLNPFYISIVALAFLLIVIIICVCVKSCNNSSDTEISTSDEIATQASTDISTHPVSTVDELIISFTDAPTAPQIMEEETLDNNIEEKSESSKAKNEKAEHQTSDDNNSSSTENDQSNNSKNKNNSSSKSSSSKKSDASSKSSSSSAIIEVSSIKLTYYYKTLEVGETITIQAIVSPSNAKNKTVSWTSSSTSVASVNSSGKVTAKKAGTATITAKAGNKTATCKITVKNAPTTVKPTEDPIKLSATSYGIVQGQIITITLNNSNGCSWKISNPSVVQVCGGGSNKITIKGLNDGSTTITATDNKTGKTYNCKVTVN